MAPAFHDYMSGISPETGWPDTARDDLTSAYESDFGGITAKVSQLEAENTALRDELNTQKVINYDLMSRPDPVAEAAAEEPAPDPDDNPDDSDDSEDADINKLYDEDE